MKDNDLNNEDEILEGQFDTDNANLTPEGEVWNKEAALKENLTEQLGRTNKRIKANLNRIKDELGLDKINSVIAELIEIYEKRPPENNGIDIKSDLLVLNKSKDAIENIIKAINSKTSQFEKEVKGSAAHIQQQIDLTIKSFIDTLNEINDRFEENIKEQEEINSSLNAELQNALNDIEAHKNVNNELNKEIEKKEIEIDLIKSEKIKIEAEAANAIQDIVALKNTINGLHKVEEDNKKLNNDLNKASEEIIELKHSLSLKESSISNLTGENKSLAKSNTDLKNEIYTVKEESRSAISELILKHKEELINVKEKVKDEAEKKFEDKLRNKEEEINTIKEENRNIISELTLKYNEELINMREKIKDEAEKKYEQKIEKLKDEIYDLKKNRKIDK